MSDKRSEKRKSDNVSTITEDVDLDIQMPDTVIEFLKLLYDSRNVARADDRKPQVAAVEPEEGESRPSTPPAMGNTGQAQGPAEELQMLSEAS